MKTNEEDMEYCAVCNEPIYPEQARYHMPDGDTVCEECLRDWANYYHILGTIA